MAIEIDSLKFSYPGGFNLNVKALRIEEGKLHVVIGPNASGKTTFARILAGLIKNYGGSVLVDEVELASMDVRSRSKAVSYMHASMVKELNVPLERFVSFGRYAYSNGILGFLSKKDLRMVDEAIDLVDLNDKRGALLSELSDGELQRAFLAKVLAQHTRYTILDEPTANLDLMHKKQILSMLIDMRERSTFIVILHDINEALRVFERLIAFKDGSIEFVWDDGSCFSLKNLEELFTIRLKVCKDKDNRVIYF